MQVGIFCFFQGVCVCVTCDDEWRYRTLAGVAQTVPCGEMLYEVAMLRWVRQKAFRNSRRRMASFSWFEKVDGRVGPVCACLCLTGFIFSSAGTNEQPLFLLFLLVVLLPLQLLLCATNVSRAVCTFGCCSRTRMKQPLFPPPPPPATTAAV